MGDIVIGSSWISKNGLVHLSVRDYKEGIIYSVVLDINTGRETTFKCSKEHLISNFNPEKLIETIDLPEEVKTFVIGVTGKARGGKDTLAKHLVSLLGKEQAAMVAFADPIKEMLRVLGVDDIDKYKTLEHPLLGVTSRVMMQTLGTEWGRDTIGESIWIDIAKRIGVGKKFLVISDVRFDNEAKYVRDNGILLHVQGRGGIETEHNSESGIPFVYGDFKLDNSHELYFLYQQAYDLLEFMGMISEYEEAKL